jgi:hypothetical protein
MCSIALDLRRSSLTVRSYRRAHGRLQLVATIIVTVIGSTVHTALVRQM